jgi:actin, other eukaryote
MILALQFPVENGIVTNWDDMEKIWHHAFYNECRLAPEEHPVLLADYELNTVQAREKATQIMFETFNVPSLRLAPQSQLSLYAAGMETGLVVDCGHSSTRIVPVLQGSPIQNAIQVLSLGGANIADYMMKILVETGYCFTSNSTEREMIKDIVQKTAFVSTNLSVDMQLGPDDRRHETVYELPDGNVITLCQQRYMAPEILFQPALAGFSSYGLGELIHSVITRCEPLMRAAMYANIVLCGGVAVIPNMAARVKLELGLLAPAGTLINVSVHADAAESVWRGGVQLAQSKYFQDQAIQKDKYDEYGPTLVHHMCF